jgi:hypothetical protein
MPIPYGKLGKCLMCGEEKIMNAGTFSEPGCTHDAISSKNRF